MKSMFKCPICQGNRYNFLFTGKDRMHHIPGFFTIVRCVQCSVVSQLPLLPPKELSRYYPSASYYAYSTGGEKTFFSRLRSYLILHYYNETFITVLFSIFFPRVPAIPRQVNMGKILDVGCGTGDTLVLLKKIGWKTYGIDIDKKALAIAAKRGVEHTRFGTYEDIRSYPDNYFDAIRLYHVIEHLDNPMRCLNLIYKKLKKDGQLIIGTPNIKSLVSNFFGTYWYNLDLPRHLILFSPQTLKKSVLKEGFKFDSIEFCSAGGLVGSIQYVLDELFRIRTKLIYKQWLVMLFYPLEILFDKAHVGDVFVLRAKK